MRRLLCLFRLEFADPADMRAAIKGRPVYLAMAMDAGQRLKLKPQNLLLNLPLREGAMIEQEAMDLSHPRTTRRVSAARLAASLALGCCLPAALLNAQTPAPTEPAKAAAPPTEPAKVSGPPPAEPSKPEAAKAVAPPLELASLAWLDGCWRGDVAKYEFREHWLPLRGGLMVGAGHVVFQGKTQDYGYLRLETRAGRRLLRLDLVGQEGGCVQIDLRNGRRQGHDLHVHQSRRRISTT